MDYHAHPVQIYYEDTDLSGVVYHANYLKYFERAREHLIGPTELARLYNEDGIGFVVYKCELTFKQGARLGDLLEIRTRVEQESAYRAVFHQEVWKEGSDKPYVVGEVQLVCVDGDQNMVRMPELHFVSGKSA
ncbi:MAG: YbgC/FadM family acyl-CoA thioesterase [Deltaproteobacteria bacterium]|jgi:acyl-CoA thioester hydrolase|nr:YbgC/FadM family acyl-CoA thioesterase [Deltaproteobacteria bacterium]